MQVFRHSALYCLILVVSIFPCAQAEDAPLKISWDKNILKVHSEQIPNSPLEIWYLEAYCRAGSTDREWSETLISHTTELIHQNKQGTQLKLKCTLEDGVIVEHLITAGNDEIDFRITARNPTQKYSQAHWAQPCIRVGGFTGCQGKDKYAYIYKSFVFIDGQLQRLPTSPWATKALYTPGQVWAAPGVSKDDVNPRPLNTMRPSCGLIGCYSADDKMLLATAFEPYQELFQGVIRCLHSDFRIGGLKSGEKKSIRGKIYVMPNDVEQLLERYQQDFPEQAGVSTKETATHPRTK